MGKRNENEAFQGLTSNFLNLVQKFIFMNSKWFIGLSGEEVLEVVAPLMRQRWYLGGVTRSTSAIDTQPLGSRENRFIKKVTIGHRARLIWLWTIR